MVSSSNISQKLQLQFLVTVNHAFPLHLYAQRNLLIMVLAYLYPTHPDVIVKRYLMLKKICEAF